MLNTFFFGYLSLRWRRLVRTLILLFIVYLTIGTIINIMNSIERGYISSDTRDFIAVTASLIVLSSITSYILKPFAMNKNKFKPIVNTFFFGYLSLKWRRLIRTTSIFIFFLSIFIGLLLQFDDGIGILPIFIFFLTPLISYVVKPFVVKED
tara:strand:+ start:257 stop:712 length:456 start_codon:yes stop_codon:yes gene_type:complete